MPADPHCASEPYNRLYDMVRDAGFRLGLRVGDQLQPGRGTGGQYRNFISLELERGPVALIERILNGDLQTAAVRLIARLPTSA